jgi:hypothetical protein
MSSVSLYTARKHPGGFLFATKRPQNEGATKNINLTPTLSFKRRGRNPSQPSFTKEGVNMGLTKILQEDRMKLAV